MLTLRRARAHAVVMIAVFAAVYAVGILHRKGLVDGFGHVIACDLLAARMAARAVLDRRGAELYDFEVQTSYQQAAVEPERLPGLDPFIWPPFVAVLYVPWALLPHVPAFLLWTAFSMALLVASLLVMAREAPLTGRHWPSTLLLALSFYPVIEGLTAGNNSLPTLPIFALVYRALRAGNETAAGALLGLQFFRPQLALAALFVFVVKRRWRIIAGAAAVGVAWVLLATLLVDRRSLLDWLALAPVLNHTIFEPGMPHALLSSVSALFLIPLGPQHLGAATAAGAVASFALLAVLLWVWAGPWEPSGDGFGLRFAALLVVSPLVGQYLLLHDLAILVLAAVLVTEHHLAHGASAAWTRVRVVLAVVWLACLIGPPIITRVAPVPLVPLAVLLLGWVVLDTWRARRVAG